MEEVQALEDKSATPSVFKEMTEGCGFKFIVQLYDKEFNVPIQHPWSAGQSSF